MKRFGWLSLLLLVGGAACGGADMATPASRTLPFSVTSERDDIATAVAWEGDTAVVDIRSAGGIGALELVRLTAGWPEAVELRLHLAGLENLTLEYGATRVTAAVSSHGEGVIQGKTTAGAPETAITAADPAWIPIVIVTDDATDTAVPLQNGFFAARLPADFYAGNPGRLVVSWIDFYR